MISVRPMAPERLPWLALRAGLNIGPGFLAMEAVADAGTDHERIVGAVGFDGRTHSSISLHIALDRPIALRALMRQVFHQVFRVWGYTVATCIVRGSNARSHALVDSVGFRKVFVGRDYWAVGEDMVLYEMRRDECVWIQDHPPRIRGSARRRKGRAAAGDNTREAA